MTLLATVIVLGLAGGLFFAWRDMARRPQAWAPYLRERFWLRAMGWTAVLTVAAVVGSGLAGGGLTGVLPALGGAAFAVSWGCWVWSKGNR
jgi:hypothetical protein